MPEPLCGRGPASAYSWGWIRAAAVFVWGPVLLPVPRGRVVREAGGDVPRACHKDGVAGNMLC